MQRRLPAVVTGLVFLASGCGSAGSVAPTKDPATATSQARSAASTTPTTGAQTTSTTSPLEGALFEYVGTVLASSRHGAEACAGFLLTSLPPQCSGIPVPGLDWSEVPWAESMSGTTWAEVVLTGEFDGDELTLVAPPTPIPEGYVRETRPHPDGTPPCDEPSGGWAGMRSQLEETTAADEYAEAQPDFGGHWLYRPNPATDRVVQVYTFTGNIDQHTQQLAGLYDGAMCVGLAQRSLREVEDLRTHVTAVLWSEEAEEHGIYMGYPGLRDGYSISSGIDITRSSVYVTVVALVDRDAAQQWLDSLYGRDAVQLITVLTILNG